jgi:hypothetical protein
VWYVLTYGMDESRVEVERCVLDCGCAKSRFKRSSMC